MVFDGTTFFEKSYYNTENVLDKNVRTGLLQAIDGLAKEAFGDQIQSFSLGEYAIIFRSNDVEEPNNSSNIKSLQLYCIAEKTTDEKAIKESMNESIRQFLNRYSLNDIFKKKTKKFKKFPERLDNIFRDLILKSEDRFKSLF